MLRTPLTPAIVAVIVADPAASADTRPDPFTVATLVADDVHVVASPGSAVPWAFFAVAVICEVLPGAMVEAPVTVTLATVVSGAVSPPPPPQEATNTVARA